MDVLVPRADMPRHAAKVWAFTGQGSLSMELGRSCDAPCLSCSAETRDY
jgi:hypothetical protein